MVRGVHDFERPCKVAFYQIYLAWQAGLGVLHQGQQFNHAIDTNAGLASTSFANPGLTLILHQVLVAFGAAQNLFQRSRAA